MNLQTEHIFGTFLGTKPKVAMFFYKNNAFSWGYDIRLSGKAFEVLDSVVASSLSNIYCFIAELE